MSRRRQGQGEDTMEGNMPIYGLGFLGAVVYYIQQATNFKDGVVGFIKALLWPALLVYKLLEYLKM
jgi:hypothetical protein